MQMIDTFKAARRVATPLISIATPDPAATIQAIHASFKEPDNIPMLRWSVVTGIVGLNEKGQAAAAEVTDGDAVLSTGNPTEALIAAAKLQPKSILYFTQAHRYLDQEAVAAAVWELRDLFKADRRTLVLLSPGLTPPAELAPDILSLDEALPTEQQLAEIIKRTMADAELKPEPDILEKAVSALSGLAAFPAEQATAMSLNGKGLDVAELWQRKRRMISDTPGLSVYDGPEKFDDLGGCANIKQFLRGVLMGRRAARAIVFIDEIEKQLGGATGDTSGVTQDQLGALLSFMQDTQATGILLLGPPGSGKSAISKAAGNEAGIPTIQLDLGGTKSSLVGSSEQRLRQALKVITAVSSGRPLFLATCNSLSKLPPELRRRFSLGTFFFDLPTAEERERIWEIYRAKFDIPNVEAYPPDDGWTGAEIRNCCDISDRLNIRLTEAANFVVPVAESARDAIERLRRDAGGRFISASSPGSYRYQKITTSAPAPAGRAINTEDE